MYPGSSSDGTYDGAGFIDRLAGLPLLWQPGSTWDYGFGLDVTGLIEEKLTGQRLGDYLKASLFRPLAMTDTGFYVPPEKASRYARPLPADPDTGAAQLRSPEATQRPKFDCGGGCGVSTAGDYLRFAEMLLHKGKAGNVRILGTRTVEYMLSNQLPPDTRNLIGNADPTRADFGFGLGLAVKQSVGMTRLNGSVGMFTWPGASGTDWWADPGEDLVVVYMSPRRGRCAGIIARRSTPWSIRRSRIEGEDRVVEHQREPDPGEIGQQQNPRDSVPPPEQDKGGEDQDRKRTQLGQGAAEPVEIEEDE